MKQNKYSIRLVIIETVIILFTSMITLLLKEVLGMMTHIIPIALLIVFNSIERLLSQDHQHSSFNVANLSTEKEHPEHPLGKAEVQQKRMELFHREFQLEQQSYFFKRKKRMI